MAGWLKAHSKATGIGIVLFLIGVGIGVAGKGSTKTVTKTVAAPTVTQTVTRTVNHTTIRYRTKVVRTVSPPPSAPPPGPTSLSFSGNGGLTLRPFDLAHDSTLYWTNDGGLMAIYDNDPNTTDPVPVNSQASSGQTFLPAGHYALEVNADGNWTITIK